MKIKLTYQPEDKNAAAATLDALRRMFPAARIHESTNKAGVSAAFLTIQNTQHTNKNELTTLR